MRSEAAFDREAHQCNVKSALHPITLDCQLARRVDFGPASESFFLVIQPCKIQVADALYRRRRDIGTALILLH